MKVKDIECWIEVDGKPLKEFGVEVSEDGKKGSAWIPSKIGQDFAVAWNDPDRTRATSGCLSIDGANCGRYLLKANRQCNKFSKGSIRTSPTERRALQFGALQLTDDESCLAKDHQKVGEISLELWRCRVLGPGPRLQGSSVGEPSRVHEKTKKGLAHAVNFGAVKHIRPSRGTSTRNLDKEAMVTFTFRYRGIDILRANGIAAPEERSTSYDDSAATGQKRKASKQLVSERKVKPEVVDVEHLVEVEERVRHAEEELRRARFEMLRGQGNERIKMEDVSALISGEVIDLTEDD
ncbi:hypothetical protein BD626DRAFT_492155 [Schizophyllum amplum]|uniref:DUF7918 domain-containing protein n=1 Tax=Schizophyllum amplum TaxID=97359 RepID=A0A550CIB4_9AGAR|nr:hypothetical protein BD626DRAFT_492155 [Auriculariopsis ampla]